MKIVEDDFELEQVDETSIFWDLKVLKTVKKKDGTIESKLGDPMYGLPLESAIKRIASVRMHRKHPEAIAMKQYLEEYKQILNQLYEATNPTKN